MNILRNLLLILVVLAVPSQYASATILPKNNLHLQDSMKVSNVTEEQFNQISDAIVDMWKPIAKSHGANLVVSKNWNDSTVNAYADQAGSTWRVSMFGGLARRPEVTPDGFALVVCHELGHHFGGYPFYNGSWAGAEGQADYFATQVCARRIWKKSVNKNERIRKEEAPRRLVEICDKTWSTAEDRALCTRTAYAGLSLAKLLGALGGDPVPDLNSRDTSTVQTTRTAHPRAQCRLDTYLHGALCAKMADLKVIPGKKGSVGNNVPESEEAAAKQSCMQASKVLVGYRPRCWFGPLLPMGLRLAEEEVISSDGYALDGGTDWMQSGWF